MTGTGGAGNVGSLTLSAERGIFFHDSQRNSGAKQRRRPGFCPISPCCPSAPGLYNIVTRYYEYTDTDDIPISYIQHIGHKIIS